MTRYIAPLILGLAGCAVLMSLGLWQVQRLEWKTAILDDIDARIGAEPIALPAAPDPDADRYLPVEMSGRFTGDELHILFSLKRKGPGYRIIASYETEDGRKVLVDRGFVPIDQKDAPRPAEQVAVVGNLYWPDEIDEFTPSPDMTREIWFARDVPAMAAEMDTEPLLVVQRQASDDLVTPVPVDSSTIPNDHLQYAVTWFGLALVWLGMTAFWLWRIRQKRA